MKANKKISLFLTAMILVTSYAYFAHSEMINTLVLITHGNPKLPKSVCKTKPVVIAVIDTGFGFHGSGHYAHLCQYGHKDFTGDQKYDSSYNTKVLVPEDIHSAGHGTNIVGIIEREASKGSAPFCVVVLKYYAETESGDNNLRRSIAAIKYATDIHVDYINYSGGGYLENYEESKAVTAFLNSGGKFIAAAGNDHLELKNKVLGYYPGMADTRTIIVGNKRINDVASRTSNYGAPVNRWEVGENISAYDITLTGTSQATAVATGKIVAETESKCN